MPDFGSDETESATLNLNDALNQCPFCGSKNISSNEVMGRNESGEYYQQTECLDCGACGPSSLKTPNLSADEGWNLRVEP